MSMRYEVWDYDTGNCIGAYPDQGTALADVRATIQAHGPAASASLVLLTAPDDGDGERIAAGGELVQLAHADAPSLPSSTTRATPPPATRTGKPLGTYRSPATGDYTRRYGSGTWRSSKRSPSAKPFKSKKHKSKKD